MILRQVLSDRLAVAVDQQKAVTVLVNLRVIARTDPRSVLNFFARVRIEAARAQRFP